MLIPMRTTLVIDDHVLLEAKRQALEAGLTVSEFATLALREWMRRRSLPPTRGRFSVPTYGSSRRRDTSPQTIADFRDEDR